MTTQMRIEDQVQDLRIALQAYLLAQSRMRDHWAEGDEAVKQALWRELHECEAAAREVLQGTGG